MCQAAVASLPRPRAAATLPPHNPKTGSGLCFPGDTYLCDVALKLFHLGQEVGLAVGRDVPGAASHADIADPRDAGRVAEGRKNHDDLRNKRRMTTRIMNE